MNTPYKLFLALENRAQEASDNDLVGEKFALHTAADLVDGIGKGKTLDEVFYHLEDAFARNAILIATEDDDWEFAKEELSGWIAATQLLNLAKKGELSEQI